MGVPLRVLASGVLLLVAASATANAQERLCDASATNCRMSAHTLIDNERQGIDIGVWFFKDNRYTHHLIDALNRGVPVRIIMDPARECAVSGEQADHRPARRRGHPDAEADRRRHLPLEADDVRRAGRRRMVGRQLQPDRVRAAGSRTRTTRTRSSISREQLVPSFMTMFDNIWTNTKEYANYANVAADAGAQLSDRGRSIRG